MELFSPSLLLRNRHLQTTLTSLRLRKLVARRRAAELRRNSRELIINCGDGVRLLGALTLHDSTPRGMVALIHGWEGSINSAYILSAGTYLYRQGYSIFRLNLRDHGESHHLNRDFFISTRLGEVVEALRHVYERYPHPHNFLAGFSLGGNFVLRIAQAAPTRKLPLTGVVGVCPLIDPADATGAMEKHHPIYHHYFVRKWKRSLARKIAIFPDLDDSASLMPRNTLSSLHNYFVPRHTPYSTTADYFRAYAITPDHFAGLTIPTWIIVSDDDPIIRRHTVDTIHPSPNLHFDRQRYGGHCGFLKNFRLQSWVDERITGIFHDLL